ncbi:MAG: RIP metalloprotease RseP [Bacteroidetes bacterium]|nr:RIP metalloprotease RseP [Bacteroidota bacterium]
MEILIKAAQLILSLSILVVLHELGHFIPAKLFKTRVEKFYLFFDPWFSLFKTKKGDTEYGIGWLPLGGYVKISGMIDESMDKEQMALPPQPWEFRSKPAWQRLIIMLGGVTVNAILGVFIYICILAYWGEEYLPTQNLKYGIACDSAAFEMGLQNGDKILAVDHKVVDNFAKIPAEIIFNQAKSVSVEREGKNLDIIIPPGFTSVLIKSQGSFIAPRQTIEIEELAPGSPALKAGLLKGDKIIGIDSLQTPYFDQFRAELQKHKNQTIAVKLIRNGVETTANVAVPEEGLIGFTLKSFDTYLEFKKIDYSMIDAVPAGFSKAYHTFDDYIKQFKLIFSPETKAYKSLGGFITMGKIFSPVWDWQRFWNLTAFLSIVLAIMNLLPIPALDGGHVMFLLWEVITRRKPNEKFMEYAQTAGMILLFALLLFANGNDIIRLFQ